MYRIAWRGWSDCFPQSYPSSSDYSQRDPSWQLVCQVGQEWICAQRHQQRVTGGRHFLASSSLRGDPCRWLLASGLRSLARHLP